ncbi:MAG: hypothetical protein DWQ04_08150 [Chloroflexi bacterium]|nr:MAG: hypothetical protein DWQ04_08150 [Chloroflexota bacterium]
MAQKNFDTGLQQSAERRWHFDLYALLEGPQELYFGHETRVNVNVVETVRIDLGNGEVKEKCYLSPTKRRGVERRTLVWAPLADGRLLGDQLLCGIPHTCTKQECPICSIYGGLITSDTKVGKETRKAATFIGRLVHGGGVAVQELAPEEKQRAMHPSMLQKGPGDDPTPTPFKREYNEPGLIYPIYNHAMSVSEAEFSAAAYAFLESMARLGAGNPKGVRLFTDELLGENQPLLVLDKYLVPLGSRPVLSPEETMKANALAQFKTAALTVSGQPISQTIHKQERGENIMFTRWVGNAALQQVQEYAQQFVEAHLL